MVPFWGPVYRQYFVDRCLASLLAPGNLPQLLAKDGHRLLVATTTADWQAIEGLPIMQEVRLYVTPVHLAVDTLAPTGAGSQSAIIQQNQCHKVLLEAAHSYHAYGCMLWPDVIFSDGLCRALLRWATEGYQLVLFASLRHVQELVLEELSRRGLLSLDARPSQTCQALIISPRLLADISIRHLHPEILPYEFGDLRFPICPAHVYAAMPDGRGIALHTFHGQQIMMDLGAIPRHNTECLSRGLFEDVYLDENFVNCSKVHVVSDSDEFGILSLTPGAVGSIPDDPPAERSASIQQVALTLRLRAGMLHHTRRNSYRIRRDMFRVPVLWHAYDVDRVWRERQAQLDMIVDRATADFYRAEGDATDLATKTLRWIGDLFYYLYVRPRHLRVVIQAAFGDRNARRIVGRAIKRALPAA